MWNIKTQLQVQKELLLEFLFFLFVFLFNIIDIHLAKCGKSGFAVFLLSRPLPADVTCEEPLKQKKIVNFVLL